LKIKGADAAASFPLGEKEVVLVLSSSFLLPLISALTLPFSARYYKVVLDKSVLPLSTRTKLNLKVQNPTNWPILSLWYWPMQKIPGTTFLISTALSIGSPGWCCSPMW
jgi:hypothetical protein